jgi:hypothetical protein
MLPYWYVILEEMTPKWGVPPWEIDRSTCPVVWYYRYMVLRDLKMRLKIDA